MFGKLSAHIKLFIGAYLDEKKFMLVILASTQTIKQYFMSKSVVILKIGVTVNRHRLSSTGYNHMIANAVLLL